MLAIDAREIQGRGKRQGLAETSRGMVGICRNNEKNQEGQIGKVVPVKDKKGQEIILVSACPFLVLLVLVCPCWFLDCPGLSLLCPCLSLPSPWTCLAYLVNSKSIVRDGWKKAMVCAMSALI